MPDGCGLRPPSSGCSYAVWDKNGSCKLADNNCELSIKLDSTVWKNPYPTITKYFDGKEFKFISKKATYNRAERYCKNRKLKLFEPRGPEDNDRIIEKGSGSRTNDNIWLGIKKSGGNWVYSSDGSSIVWDNFHNLDNYRGDENCVESEWLYGGGQWNDVTCSSIKARSFVCEGPDSSLELREQISGKSYTFHNDGKTQQDAVEACLKLPGGKLYEPKDANVFQKIVEMASKRGINHFWLGINDKSNEGNFVYQSDNSPIVFDFWANGEPNNKVHTADGVEQEHCVASKYYINHKWNDQKCNCCRFSYVCEY
jgi:hypothetical protein